MQLISTQIYSHQNKEAASDLRVFISATSSGCLQGPLVRPLTGSLPHGQRQEAAPAQQCCFLQEAHLNSVLSSRHWAVCVTMSMRVCVCVCVSENMLYTCACVECTGLHDCQYGFIPYACVVCVNAYVRECA